MPRLCCCPKHFFVSGFNHISIRLGVMICTTGVVVFCFGVVFNIASARHANKFREMAVKTITPVHNME